MTSWSSKGEAGRAVRRTGPLEALAAVERGMPEGPQLGTQWGRRGIVPEAVFSNVLHCITELRLPSSHK
eukprot:13611155-Alexandrium_andersonii.AAC.1